MNLGRILERLPEVANPTKKLTFKDKLKWTGVALLIYFLLSLIPLYGLDPNYKSKFEMLSILLAAQFGSIISLGIGPIVTASIILQLLVGAEIIKLDLNTHEGRKTFQGMQKLFGLVFIVLMNTMYVLSNALPAAGGSAFNMGLMVFQLIIGGIILMFLDEVVSKWGIGSGISLFIAGSISREIFINIFNPMPDPTNPTLAAGNIPKSIGLIIQGFTEAALWPLIAVGATIIVFLLATYLQAVKVNIPLSFGRFRGFSFKWPLKFIYTSNIPVIFTASLIASMQFWGLTMYHMGIPLLGTFKKVDFGGQIQEVPESGLVMYLNPPTIRDIILQGMLPDYAISILVFSLMMIIGSVLFSLLWINIGGQDPGSVAGQILSSGLRIPGFRADKRILERLLARYIKPLAILGGASVGALAVVADLLGAVSRGTGILLTVMIVYQFYEQIMRDHYNELSPGMQAFFKK